MKVQPIRDRTKIVEIEAFLHAQNMRDFVLFELGINSGLRISDLLKIRVGDIDFRSGLIPMMITKTRSSHEVALNKKIYRILREYTKTTQKNVYLFRSRQGVNKPLSRSGAYKMFAKVGRQVGIVSFGTHTLRKTYGYHFYKQKGELAKLQLIFGHKNAAQTLDYIGVTTDELRQAQRDFTL